MSFLLGSNWWEQQKLNYLLDSMESEPTTVELRPYNGSPDEDGTGGTDRSTISGGAQTVNFGAPSLVDGVYQISNSSIVDFGTATDDIGVIDYVALWANISGIDPEMIAYGQLAVSKNILTSDPFNFPVGEIKIAIEQFWAATAAQALLNWIRGTFPSSITDLFVGLFDGEPGIGSEVTTSIRSGGRVQPSEVMGDRWNDVSESSPYYQFSNAGKIDFGASENSLINPITHAGVFDASSGGNLLMWGTLGESLQISSGNNVYFDPGQLILRAA